MSDNLQNIAALRKGAARANEAGFRHASSLHVTTLLAHARHSLGEDLDLARLYLDQLSAIFEDGRDKEIPDSPLLPGRLVAGVHPTRGGLANWQVRKVTDHIEQQLDTALTIEELAAVVRLSAGYFCRAFKVSMGETPHAYIVRQRIRRAQTLMLETRDTLSRIACACGLTDQAHLTRLFRRIVGTTPMAWRRNWQDAA